MVQKKNKNYIMKGIILIITIHLVLVIGCKNSNQEINYPKPLPDSKALTFMPGIVSNEAPDSLDFNSTFSPDGKAFYFSRSVKGKYVIYVSYFNENTWQQPTPATFNDGAYSNADPMFHPDGTLYYMSNRPKNASDTIPDFDIWFIKEDKEHKWSQPENVSAINSDSTEYYVSFAGNGNLYFASDRSGGAGQWDIYVSKYQDGKYLQPENLGLSINSDSTEHDPCVSKDEQLILFTSVGRQDGFGEGDIYYSIKEKGEWGEAKNIGKHINTPTYEYCSYLTADGKFYFYSSKFNIMWINRNYLIKE